MRKTLPMTIRNGRDIRFRAARPDHLAEVLAVVDGSAAYLHRMAVRRTEAGLGPVILAWAADIARQHDCDALRLDCVASNGRLRAYYEAAGFACRGDVAVGGAPGQRLEDGPVTVVSRYEMPLAPRFIRSG